VVVPTYQEAANVVEAITRLRAAAPTVGVLVVDDASPDGTADVVDAAAPGLGDVWVLRRPAKAGLGSAYRDGFRWGIDHGFDVLVEMDADLSHDAAALASLLRPLDLGADLVIGSRYLPGGSIPAWSAHRRALSRWGNRYAAAMLRLGVLDATSGYRAFLAGALLDIDFERIRADGYGFQIETTYRLVRLGRRVVEVPISFVDRTEGTSKMSWRIVAEALVLVTGWGVRDRVVAALTGRTRRGTRALRTSRDRRRTTR
jgi:dolichol-phosphate mannosyltransferase